MKLRLFIGSSSESQDVAQALESALTPGYDVVPWYRDVFPAGSNALADLLCEVRESHLAIFVYAPDDVVTLRSAVYSIPRDNVIFELGLFMSKLGPRGCFLLVPSDVPDLRIPTDVLGLTTLRFSRAEFAADPAAALASAVRRFTQAHKNLNTEDGSRPALAGSWDLTWVVESQHFNLVNPYNLELAQVGNRVLGEYTAQPLTGSSFPVYFDGTIEGQVLTGRWRGSGYSGAFHLAIDLTWNKMTGRWIGQSQSEGVKSGLYQWVRRA
jgi:hypothetical protein